LAYDTNNRRKIKIGKTINKVFKKDRKKRSELLRLFNHDPLRQAKSHNYIAVISRHPYDIAGMSTDRGWTSCMNLRDGPYNYYVPSEIKKGSLIAYATKEDDPDLKNPVCRVMIKPFVEVEKVGSDYVKDPDIFFGVEDRVYGEEVDGFVDAVLNWVEEVNQSKALNKVLEVELRQEVYRDSISDRKLIADKKASEKFEYYLQRPQEFSDDYQQLDPKFIEFFASQYGYKRYGNKKEFLWQFFKHHVLVKGRTIGNLEILDHLLFLDREGMFDELNLEDQIAASKISSQDSKNHLRHVRNPKSPQVAQNILANWVGMLSTNVTMTPEFQDYITKNLPNSIFDPYVFMVLNQVTPSMFLKMLKKHEENLGRVAGAFFEVFRKMLSRNKMTKKDFMKVIEAWPAHSVHLILERGIHSLDREFMIEIIKYLGKKHEKLAFPRFPNEYTILALAEIDLSNKDNQSAFEENFVRILIDKDREAAKYYFQFTDSAKKAVRKACQLVLNDKSIQGNNMWFSLIKIKSFIIMPPKFYEEPIVAKAMKKAELKLRGEI